MGSRGLSAAAGFASGFADAFTSYLLEQAQKKRAEERRKEREEELTQTYQSIQESLDSNQAISPETAAKAASLGISISPKMLESHDVNLLDVKGQERYEAIGGYEQAYLGTRQRQEASELATGEAAQYNADMAQLRDIYGEEELWPAYEAQSSLGNKATARQIFGDIIEGNEPSPDTSTAAERKARVWYDVTHSDDGTLIPYNELGPAQKGKLFSYGFSEGDILSSYGIDFGATTEATAAIRAGLKSQLNIFQTPGGIISNWQGGLDIPKAAEKYLNEHYSKDTGTPTPEAIQKKANEISQAAIDRTFAAGKIDINDVPVEIRPIVDKLIRIGTTKSQCIQMYQEAAEAGPPPYSKEQLQMILEYLPDD